MRILCAIALLLVAAGCQRSGTAPPVTVIAAPAATISANTSLPATLPAVKAASKTKKPASPVLATVLAKPDRSESRASIGEDASDDDPCIGLADAAWDDCVARNDPEPTNTDDNNSDQSLDRPELDPRDRELISAEDAAARERDDVQEGPSEDQAPDYAYSDDDPPPEDDLSPEDYPPDEDSDPQLR